MAKKKQKYYVVWQGKSPGIYSSWEECKQQVTGVVGAKYKSYENREAAEQAYTVGWKMAQSMTAGSNPNQGVLGIDDLGMTYILSGKEAEAPVLDAVAVDAACSGNPGVMEYQGVYVATRTRLFHFKSPVGTNNIGEFLAIVHGLAYMKKNNMRQVLYSDSRNAIGWVRAKQCKTKLPHTEETAALYDIIRRAELWLRNNSYDTEIRKWDTESWGEIPADFNRK